MIDVESISDVTSEAGIIASLIAHPDFIFYNEQLEPAHFTNESNSKYYKAISYLAKQGIDKIDAVNLVTAMNATGIQNQPSVYEINDFIENAVFVQRETVEEYKLLASSVLDKSFRRDLYRKLKSCEGLCATATQETIREKVYGALDAVIMNYSSVDEIPQIKDVADSLWDDIIKDQNPERTGDNFKFSTLNNYIAVDRGELVIFGARAKAGKSMMLLNCAVDLLRKGKSVLYIDSELNSKNFMLRLISHVSQVEFKKIKRGTYGEVEADRIDAARKEIKTWKFTHKYIPIADEKTIYGITKKIYHSNGVDVLILDYLKSKKDSDAFGTYQEMGKIADMCKNVLAGDMDIAALSAVQLTKAYNVADSSNIERALSSLVYIIHKTQDEIEEDGVDCGNCKLIVRLNRNGEQMIDGEYIDVNFDGNRCTFTEAKQHIPKEPV